MGGAGLRGDFPSVWRTQLRVEIMTLWEYLNILFKLKQTLQWCYYRNPINQWIVILDVNINSKHHQKDIWEGSILKLLTRHWRIGKEWNAWYANILYKQHYFLGKIKKEIALDWDQLTALVYLRSCFLTVKSLETIFLASISIIFKMGSQLALSIIPHEVIISSETQKLF